ncbi:MAG: DeoR family transcriptional regulator [Candidatus Margulisiibacteriota bacterium]
MFAADLNKMKEKEIELELNQRQKQFLGKLGVEEMISSSSYAELFDIDERTARRDLTELTKKGLLLKEGRGYRTVYKKRVD